MFVLPLLLYFPANFSPTRLSHSLRSPLGTLLKSSIQTTRRFSFSLQMVRSHCMETSSDTNIDCPVAFPLKA